MRPILFLLLLVAAGMACSSCSVISPLVFADLKPGTSLTGVTDAVGRPDRLVGVVITAYGQRVSVLEYEKRTDWMPPTTTVFWVYLADGVYVKFSHGGDWRSVSKELYITDFRQQQR
jgi:hypothetical protein